MLHPQGAPPGSRRSRWARAWPGTPDKQRDQNHSLKVNRKPSVLRNTFLALTLALALTRTLALTLALTLTLAGGLCLVSFSL